MTPFYPVLPVLYSLRGSDCHDDPGHFHGHRIRDLRLRRSGSGSCPCTQEVFANYRRPSGMRCSLSDRADRLVLDKSLWLVYANYCEPGKNNFPVLPYTI